MLKRILLPLENSPYSIAVIEYSCFIAKRQDAEVIRFSFENEIGMPNSKIINLSNYYDLIVTGLKSDFGLIKKDFCGKFL